MYPHHPSAPIISEALITKQTLTAEIKNLEAKLTAYEDALKEESEQDMTGILSQIADLTKEIQTKKDQLKLLYRQPVDVELNQAAIETATAAVSLIAMDPDGNSMGDFNTWYNDRVIRCLLHGDALIAGHFIVTFEAESEQNTFQRQLQQFSLLANTLLPNYSFFICFEPGQGIQIPHFIVGILSKKHQALVIINPIGLGHHQAFHNTLETISTEYKVLVSTTPLQHDPQSLVSCGPLCVDVILNFVEDEPKLEALFTSDSHPEQKGYCTLDISQLLNEELQALIAAEPKKYQAGIIAIRKRHLAQLRLNDSVVDTLINAPAQVAMNILLMGGNILTLVGESEQKAHPAYVALQASLQRPSQKPNVFAQDHIRNVPKSYSNNQERGLQHLPVEVQLLICIFLDINSLLKFGMTTKENNLLIKDPFVWKELYKRDFPERYSFYVFLIKDFPEYITDAWKVIFKEEYRLKKLESLSSRLEKSIKKETKFEKACKEKKNKHQQSMLLLEQKKQSLAEVTELENIDAQISSEKSQYEKEELQLQSSHPRTKFLRTVKNAIKNDNSIKVSQLVYCANDRMLHLAVNSYFPFILQLLLELKSDVNAKDKDRNTLIYQALVNYNVKNKSDNQQLRDTTSIYRPNLLNVIAEEKSNGQHPQLLPIEVRKQRLIISLLIYKGAQINEKHKITGYTPFHLSLRGSPAPVVQMLLANGADTNIECPNKKTLLHLLAENCKYFDDLAKLEIFEWKNIDACDGDKNTPLHIALKAKDNQGNTAKDIALEKSNIYFLLFFTQKGLIPVDVSDKNGNTLFHLLADEGKLVECRKHEKELGKNIHFLLKKGLNINQTNATGKTALQIAKQHHYDIAVRCFILNGANVAARYSKTIPADTTQNIINCVLYFKQAIQGIIKPSRLSFFHFGSVNTLLKEAYHSDAVFFGQLLAKYLGAVLDNVQKQKLIECLIEEEFFRWPLLTKEIALLAFEGRILILPPDITRNILEMYVSRCKELNQTAGNNEEAELAKETEVTEETEVANAKRMLEDFNNTLPSLTLLGKKN